MTQPKQPADPPSEGASLDTNPTGHAPHGIPRGVEDMEPKGSPNSDRHETESAPNKA